MYTWFLLRGRHRRPRPCGYLSNATGLSLESQCQDVAKGEWAPIGSAVPEPCPSSGFFCPGRAYDDVTKVPGSLPIAIRRPDATKGGRGGGDRDGA